MEQIGLTPAESLCLSCGLCCSGVLHNWTFLQPEEVDLASKLGLEVIQPSRRQTRSDPRPVFRQPCRALDGTTCQIYKDRPQACRVYTCHVLQRMEIGELSQAEAQELVSCARHLIDELRAKMSHPAAFLSLDWQVKVNWRHGQALPEDVAPVFTELVDLLRREWKTKWQRGRPRRR